MIHANRDGVIGTSSGRWPRPSRHLPAHLRALFHICVRESTQGPTAVLNLADTTGDADPQRSAARALRERIAPLLAAAESQQWDDVVVVAVFASTIQAQENCDEILLRFC